MQIKLFLKTLYAACLLFTTASVYGQNKSNWQISFGVNPGIPAAKVFNSNLGADIRLQKTFNPRLAGTLTAGFTHFFEKNYFVGYQQYSSPYNVIPVKAGLIVFLSDKFYAGGEAGAGFAFEQWRTSFLWSPSFGMAFKNGLDVSVKYEDYTKNEATKDISLRLAYGIDAGSLAFHKKSTPAQGWSLGFSINPGLTTNDFTDMAIGSEVSIHKPLTTNIEASFAAGITHYFNTDSIYFFKSDERNVPHVTFDHTTSYVIPLKAGLRFYAGNKLYAGGEAGAALAAYGRISFVYAPSLGLTFNNGSGIAIKYENYSGKYAPDQLMLHFSYRFKL